MFLGERRPKKLDARPLFLDACIACLGVVFICSCPFRDTIVASEDYAAHTTTPVCIGIAVSSHRSPIVLLGLGVQQKRDDCVLQIVDQVLVKMPISTHFQLPSSAGTHSKWDKAHSGDGGAPRLFLLPLDMSGSKPNFVICGAIWFSMSSLRLPLMSFSVLESSVSAFLVLSCCCKVSPTTRAVAPCEIVRHNHFAGKSHSRQV